MKNTQNQKKPFDPSNTKIAKNKVNPYRKGLRFLWNFAIEFDISRAQHWRMEKGTNFIFQSLLKILDTHKISFAEFFKILKNNNISTKNLTGIKTGEVCIVFLKKLFLN